MSGVIPHLPGWLPDPWTGGTAYWDGARFTGDRRPPRRRFAAAARHATAGTIWLAGGVLLLVTGVKALWTPGLWLWRVTDPPEEGTFERLARALDDLDAAFSLDAFAASAVYVAFAMASAARGVYCLRGRGPTTRAVNQRLANEHRTAVRAQQQYEAALNSTDWGRARKAFQQGARTFEATLRIDTAGYLSTVDDIETEGWILAREQRNPREKTTVSTPHSDGSHTVVRSWTQTTTFYFIRNVALD